MPAFTAPRAALAPRVRMAMASVAFEARSFIAARHSDPQAVRLVKALQTQADLLWPSDGGNEHSYESEAPR